MRTELRGRLEEPSDHHAGLISTEGEKEGCESIFDYSAVLRTVQ